MKDTKTLAEALQVIAATLQSNYCRSILEEAAERLTDLDKIATFYHTQLGRNEICKDMSLKR